MEYYRKWLKYKREYDREHYVKTAVRRDLYNRIINLCRKAGNTSPRLNECLEKILEIAEGKAKISKPLEELIESAVKLANKYPGEEESRRIFELWELLES